MHNALNRDHQCKNAADTEENTCHKNNYMIVLYSMIFNKGTLNPDWRSGIDKDAQQL
jgi:hypothetical protein